MGVGAAGQLTDGSRQMLTTLEKDLFWTSLHIGANGFQAMSERFVAKHN